MVLSINVAAAAAADATKCDENSSPLKRKSDLISPSVAAAACTTSNEVVRCPLSEINAISEHDGNTAKVAVNETTRPSTTSKFLTTKSTSTAATSTYSAIKCNKFKSQIHRPSKDEIEATNEKQATVNQLSEWLANEASKKNKKVPIIDRPPLSASDINYLRFQNKPRIKKADVEATDNKRVSVKTISSWMSDDPFEQKKVRTIRTGHKIIAKSRVFEMDTAVMASRQCDIKVGSVEEKSAWLSGAFKHEGTAGEDSKIVSATSSSFSAEKKVVRPYQIKTAKKEDAENELKSVKEKKEWLSNAFAKKGSDSSSSAMSHQTKSNEWHPIQQTQSHDANHNIIDSTTPDIVKSASADASQHVPSIYSTKSYDYHEEESTIENELKSVKDKQEWLSNAFNKKSSEMSGAVVGRHSQPSEMQHPRRERTTPTPSLYQNKSFEMNSGSNAPSITKSRSADDNSQHVPIIHRTQIIDGSSRSRPSSTTTASIEKNRGDVVSLYQKDVNEEISSEKTTLRSVKDKQAWLSSAFKAPASSKVQEMTGGVSTKQQQPKGVIISGAAVVVADKSTGAPRTTIHNPMERQSTVANAKPHDETTNHEENLEKMTVAERAMWLKMAFK